MRRGRTTGDKMPTYPPFNMLPLLWTALEDDGRCAMTAKPEKILADGSTPGTVAANEVATARQKNEPPSPMGHGCQAHTTAYILYGEKAESLTSCWIPFQHRIQVGYRTERYAVPC